MKSLRVKANQFGPISEADIELKPLTIFIGPNNTGKSCIAQLVYAISEANRQVQRSIYSSQLAFFDDSRFLRVLKHEYSMPPWLPKYKFTKTTLTNFEQLLPPNYFEYAQEIKKPINVKYDSLPEEIRDIIQKNLEFYFIDFKRQLEHELQRCFDAKISNLVCRIKNGDKFFLSIENDAPKFSLHYESRGNKLEEISRIFPLGKQTVTLALPRYSRTKPTITGAIPMDNEELLNVIILRIIINNMDRLQNILPKRCFYLPAARSGILQGQKAIARAGLRTLERAGIKEISIPKLPGVIIDFLDAIYSIDKDEHGDFNRLARELEQRLTPGRILFMAHKEELPEIFFYEPHVGKLSLHRTSSMISELAPIIVILRYLVKKGDTIIVEEPEAHMHPSAQREIAKILVKLVNRGVNVITTTHSDYMLQQIGNLIAFSTKMENQRENMPYKPEELISPENVAAYLFNRDSSICGSRVLNLEVGKEGIQDAQFSQVAEALYQEAIVAKED